MSERTVGRLASEARDNPGALARRAALLIRVASLALLVALVFGGAPARAPRYRFVRIVDNGDSSPFTGFSYVALNAEGKVAFVAIRKASAGGGHGVYLSDGNTVTLLAESGSAANSARFSFFPSLNSGGAVSLKATPSIGSDGLFLLTGAASTRIASEDDDSPFCILKYPSLNASGMIVFFAERRDGSQGLFVAQGTKVAPVIDNGPSTPFRSFGGAPSLNAGGTIALIAARKPGLPGEYGVFTITGGAVTTIADTGTRTPFTGFFHPVINSAGTVAFLALRKKQSGGGRGLFTGRGDATTLLVDDGPRSPFYSFDPQSINDGGLVAFRSLLKRNGRGIWTTRGHGVEPVVRTGDPLDGSRVTDDLVFYREGLNNHGSVAFLARLVDGRVGVYRADP